MSNNEHLIENCLLMMEANNDYKKIIETLNQDTNLQYASLTVDEVWEVCQYFYYSYLNGR